MKTLKDLIPVEDRFIAKTLLYSARKKLNPTTEFVCCNLSDSAETSDEYRIVDILRGEISRRLEGWKTVCLWLREEVGIEDSQVFAREGWRLVEYRQRWIDSMIAELK